MRFLRSNTAVIVTVGPFYDKTDGVTIETALTITNEKITLTADTDAGSAPTNILDNVTGATSGTANDLNYITGNDAGMMQLELAAADVNRVGRMFLSITDAANHVPVFHEFFVLPAAIFDWLTGVIVPLPANVTQLLGTAWLTPGTAGTPDVNAKLLGGTAQTGRDVGASVLLSSGTGTGQILLSSGKVVTPDDQKVDVNTLKTQALTVGAAVTILASVGTAATSTAQTGDNFARLGAPAGASVSADIAAAKVDTAAIKVTTDKFVFTVANQVDSNVITKTGFVLSATGSAALTEGYPAKGGTGTLPQILYNILQLLEERSIASTTLTILKRDQATTAGTYTLDSATTPNSQTRAT